LLCLRCSSTIGDLQNFKRSKGPETSKKIKRIFIDARLCNIEEMKGITAIIQAESVDRRGNPKKLNEI